MLFLHIYKLKKAKTKFFVSKKSQNFIQNNKTHLKHIYIKGKQNKSFENEKNKNEDKAKKKQAPFLNREMKVS